MFVDLLAVRQTVVVAVRILRIGAELELLPVRQAVAVEVLLRIRRVLGVETAYIMPS